MQLTLDNLALCYNPEYYDLDVIYHGYYYSNLLLE